MKRSSIIAACCLCAALVVSCGKSKPKKNIVFYDTEQSDTTEQTSAALADYSTDVEYTSDDNTVAVPFTEKGGVKFIDVSVNGEFTVPMILDSGCSTTLISIAEARYLYEKGCFNENDILGVAQSQIADGSIVEDMVINLRQIVIGGKIACTNVQATVSSNAQAPLLLGNEVLNRAPAYSVDNVNQQIIFHLK